MLVGRKADVLHDKSIVTLLETARAHNIIFSLDTLVLKSNDLTFFVGNLTPEGFMVDPRKCKLSQK